MNRVVLAAFFTVLFLSASQSFAACTNPPGTEGETIYNGDYNVPQVCTGTDWVALGVLNPAAGGSGCTNPVGVEGEVVYNGDIHKPQYCDGDDWRVMIGNIGGGGCTAPALCPNIGDVCDDGNVGSDPDPIFAGFMAYSDPNSADVGECKPLYVTNDNQSTASQWKTATGTDDIATDSTEDGKINDGQVANSSTFPAFKLCKDLTDGGFNDWYLPARVELNLLWLNRTAINANAAGNFLTGGYQSSTETGTGTMWGINFSDGSSNPNFSKTFNNDVRCVRR